MLLVRAPHDPFAFNLQARAHGRGERGSPPPSDAAPVVALRTSNWQICCPRVLTPGRIICPTFARSFSTFCRHAPWRCCGRHALACGAGVHPRKRRGAPPTHDAAPVRAVRTCTPIVLTRGRMISATFARSFSAFCRHAPWRCCGRHALTC